MTAHPFTFETACEIVAPPLSIAPARSFSGFLETPAHIHDAIGSDRELIDAYSAQIVAERVRYEDWRQQSDAACHVPANAYAITTPDQMLAEARRVVARKREFLTSPDGRAMLACTNFERSAEGVLASVQRCQSARSRGDGSLPYAFDEALDAARALVAEMEASADLFRIAWAVSEKAVA